MDRSLYNCSTARFDGTARALTVDEMRVAAPSIFAVEAHESRSTRFAPIPTFDVLQGLQRAGFSPVACRQAVCRVPDRAPFTKHLIRLRQLEDTRALRVNDTVVEVILKNANDGSAAYELDLGLFRICCLNSLVVQTGSIDSVKIRHSGRDIVDRVIEGTYQVLDNAQEALAAPVNWPHVNLERGEQEAFAAAAHVLRFEDQDAPIAQAVTPVKLLECRRPQDRAQNLWTTYNVVQENAIVGGVGGYARNANNQLRRVRTRAVTGIDQDVKLNKALFVLASKMAELKAA